MIGASLTPDILREVHHERILQDNKWGEQNHDPFTYLAILGEEVGEANQAALEMRWPPKSELGPTADKVRLDHFRAELIQVAAVAVAMVECLDRGKWNNEKEIQK